MTKHNYDISIQQRADLLAAYRKIAPYCLTQQQAWQRTVSSPAPRYYVSRKQAFQKVVKMVKGDFSEVDAMKPLRRQMYYSLYEQTLKAINKREFANMPLFYIMQFVVCQPAPSFFLTPYSMMKVFPIAKKEDEQKRKQKATDVRRK